MDATFIFGTIATVFYSANLLLFIVLHIKNREYSIRRNAVSDYDIGSTHAIFQIYLWIGNLGAIALSAAFLFSTRYSIPIMIPVLFLIMVAFRIGVGIFKTNIEGEKLTPKGLMHYLFAVGQFAAAYTIIQKVDSFLFINNQMGVYGSLFSVYEYIVTVALVGVVLTMFKPLRFLFGICERLYIILLVVWFGGMSIWVMNYL